GFTAPANLEYVDLEGNAKEKDQPGLKKLLDDLGAIRVEKTADFVSLSNKQLDDLGLTEKTATFKIDIKSGEKKDVTTETLLIGEKFKSKEKEKDTDDKDKEKEPKEKYYYYARLLKSPYKEAARVDAKQLELIMQVLQDPKILRS